MSISSIPLSRPSVFHQFLLPHSQGLEHVNFPEIQESILDGQNFGTLTLKMPENTTATLSNPIHWILNIDRSGSMDEEYNGKTKMENVKHMLKNLISYLKTLSTEEHPNYLTIIIFDHYVETVCEHFNLNSDENAYTTYVEQIWPRGATNFERAFDEANRIANTYACDDHENIIQIFMTDGHITSGSRNLDTLVGKCEQSLTHSANTTRSPPRVFFVGFGLDHNSLLMQNLTDRIDLSQYYFVENIENAGFVYGEIANEIIKEFMHTITIDLQYGEIYNYLTNTWVHNLTIASLPLEVEKTFHIRTPLVGFLPEEQRSIKIEFSGTLSNYVPAAPGDLGKVRLHSQFLHHNIDYPNRSVEKFLWRQGTQELLFETKKVLLNATSQSSFRDKLSEFLRKLKQWSTEQDLEGDQFIQDLCDDIYAAIKSLNVDHDRGYMFVNARQTTQGLQRAYNLRDFTGLNSPTMSNQTTRMDSLGHVPTLSRFTSYATPSQDQAMRSVSEGTTQINARLHRGIPIDLTIGDSDKTTSL